jgi:hypothetical protein
MWLKSNKSRGGFRFPTFSNDRFMFAGPVALLIADAYHLPFNPGKRLSGGPDWIRGPGLSSSARDERGADAAGMDRFRAINSMAAADEGCTLAQSLWPIW